MAISEADRLKLRKERKGKAVKTVAKNAKVAAEAKAKARSKGATLGNEDFMKKAKAVEERINPKPKVTKKGDS